MEILLLWYIVTSIIVGTTFFYIKYCDIFYPSYFDDPTFTETIVVFLIGMILSPFIFPIVIIVGFWKVINNILERIEETKCQK